jgi:DNA-binding PadR family transcriptional regulator
MTPSSFRRFLPLKAVHHSILLLLEEKPTFGIELLDRLESEFDIELNAGSLYRTIGRLVDDGLLAPSETESGSVGAPRKTYRVTSLGRSVLRAEAERQARLLELAQKLKLHRGGP